MRRPPDELVSGQKLTFRCYNRSHLSTHMGRVPLAPVDIGGGDADDTTSLPVLAAGVWILGLSFIAVRVYGIVALPRDLP